MILLEKERDEMQAKKEEIIQDFWDLGPHLVMW